LIKKYKIIFRCDAGIVKEIGTGHLYRCILLAKFFLGKKNIKRNDILFIIKSKKKYRLALKILRKNNFNFVTSNLNNNLKNNTRKELNFLSNFNSNLLIIDRLGRINSNFVKELKYNFKKMIIFEDMSNNRKLFDLSINALITNVPKQKNCLIGYKYVLLNSYKYSIKFFKKNNGIFIFLGNFYPLKLLKNLHKIIRLNFRSTKIYLPQDFKKELKNYNRKLDIFYNSSDWIHYLKKAKLCINAGGLGVFESLLMRKKIISIPIYNHQKINSIKLSKLNYIFYLNKHSNNFESQLINLIRKIENKKDFLVNNKIINSKNIKLTLNKIYRVYLSSFLKY